VESLRNAVKDALCILASSGVLKTGIDSFSKAVIQYFNKATM